MGIEEINISKIKQNLSKIPRERLAEVNAFIESILVTTGSGRFKRVEKLKGIWKGLGFERIPDLEERIREIRNESEKSIPDRMAKCNT